MDRLNVKYKIYVNIMDCLDVKESWKRGKVDFFEIDAQRSNVGVSFLLFLKNKLSVSFYGRLSFPFFQKSQVFPKMCYLRKYAVFGCKSMDTFGCMSMPFGCMSMPFGCMSMDRLGACMRLLGASLRRRLGACMRLLGASFITAESLPDSR